MAFPPAIRYFLGGAEMPVSPGSPIWGTPLPTNRHYFRGSSTGSTVNSGPTHGDYFIAARRFLERDQFRIISEAFLPERADRISDVHVCLMKHGEFYHPARIRVTTHGRSRSFVLNVALSLSGRRVIGEEVSALKRLGEISRPSFIPKVYGYGSAEINGNLTADMFLGEWFEGYHEFHISHGPAGNPQTLCVWGENDIPYYLTSEEAYCLYRQAAKILTLYYNMTTTEHISQWHHAGGDFVIKNEPNQLAVKLITVRQYCPLLRMDQVKGDSSQKCDQAMAALLLFFLTLSIRMRLDRLDGTGDVAWADDSSLAGIWTGFLEGLTDCYFPYSFNPAAQFESYLSVYSTAGLRDLAETLTAVLPISSVEKSVVETNIGRHMEVLCNTISRIGFP